jgi:hypothetical protein
MKTRFSREMGGLEGLACEGMALRIVVITNIVKRKKLMRGGPES